MSTCVLEVQMQIFLYVMNVIHIAGTILHADNLGTATGGCGAAVFSSVLGSGTP